MNKTVIRLSTDKFNRYFSRVLIFYVFIHYPWCVVHKLTELNLIHNHRSISDIYLHEYIVKIQYL